MTMTIKWQYICLSKDKTQWQKFKLLKDKTKAEQNELKLMAQNHSRRLYGPAPQTMQTASLGDYNWTPKTYEQPKSAWKLHTIITANVFVALLSLSLIFVCLDCVACALRFFVRLWIILLDIGFSNKNLLKITYYATYFLQTTKI